MKATYENIDMFETGRNIKKLVNAAGFTPKMIQEYLHLSCVQPIYRWYKGIILPSVDNLLMLSELLGLHMEELLVKKKRSVRIYDIEYYSAGSRVKYCITYVEVLYKGIA